MTGYLEAGPYRANQDGLIGRDRRTLHPSVLKALGHPALAMVKPEKGFIDPRNEWQKVFVNDFLPPFMRMWRSRNAGDVMSPHSLDAPTLDKRKAKRRKVLSSGNIIFNNGHCNIACYISDLSDSGARLRPSDVFSCPDVFTLKISHGPVHECEVVHRFRDTLGVKFVT